MTYKTLGMVHSYMLKDINTGGVPYMSEADRNKYKIAIAAGILFTATGRGLTTSGGQNPMGKFIFVMDGAGTIYAGPNQEVHHHSSFLSGRPIASAGLIGATDGKITYLDGESGHYMPPKDYFQQVITELKKQKVKIENGVVHYEFNLTSDQVEKIKKKRSNGQMITDYVPGTTIKDSDVGIPIGQHQQGQVLRLYPGSKPQWQWY